MANTDKTTDRSPLLPTDEYDVKLRDLMGHPNGAHTEPSLLQAVDEYGNVSSFMIQTVKWDAGTTVFVTKVTATEHKRLVLPPAVVRTILRQQEQVTAIVRRRHGKRLAEQRRAAGVVPTFTPEQRKKAIATRRARAKARAARRERRKQR